MSEPTDDEVQAELDRRDAQLRAEQAKQAEADRIREQARLDQLIARVNDPKNKEK